MLHLPVDLPADFTVEKIFLPDIRPADAGMIPRYPVEHAAWVWHPALAADSPAFLHFQLDFTAGAGETDLPLHFSADQYAELRLDEVLIARGPEASPVHGTSFSSFQIRGLCPGPHRLVVFAWWLGRGRPNAPLSRETLGAGLIVASEGAWTERIQTGVAPWQVRVLDGLRPDTERNFHHAFGIGCGLFYDARKAHGTKEVWVDAEVRCGPLTPSKHGVLTPRYRLRPARLPEQFCRPLHPGRVRAVVDDFVTANGWGHPLHVFREKEGQHPRLADWQTLWSGAAGQGMEIPAQSAVSVLVDLEDYYCGFPCWQISGGRDAELVWDWAESLIQPPGLELNRQEDQLKGQRDQVFGKSFRGLSDTFIADGAAGRTLRSHWWRSGRYVLLRIRTANEPLRLDGLAVVETRYPLEIQGAFQCDQDDSFASVWQICRRGLEMCMHETYVDCPHYEQLMYVFDTRLEILTTYVLSADDRLPRRAIELFDLSRIRFSGLAASRFPCLDDQLIPGFSLCWTWMVRDYLYWRDDADWLRQFLPGVRAVHDVFEQLENRDGLLENLPGWKYGDWVRNWPVGCPPEVAGVSAIFNLMYLHSLNLYADLEDKLGDPTRAAPILAKADRLRARIRERFWHADSGILADDASGTVWSQHAQIWGVLSGALTAEESGPAMEACLTRTDFEPASYMLRSHLFDAMAAVGRGGEIWDQLQAWQEMVAIGACTGFEHQEPTRSDCHAWSSHPLYHLPATLLGIQPTAPGFRELRIAPQPGAMRQAKTSLPHPRGFLRADLRFEGEACTGRIELPPETTGHFEWRGQTVALRPGQNPIQFTK